MGAPGSSATHVPYFIKSSTNGVWRSTCAGIFITTSSPSHHYLRKGARPVIDMVDFALTTRAGDDGTTRVELAGELDLHRVPALADALQGAAGHVVVDLQEVTFLDSTTLALLVR